MVIYQLHQKNMTLEFEVCDMRGKMLLEKHICVFGLVPQNLNNFPCNNFSMWPAILQNIVLISSSSILNTDTHMASYSVQKCSSPYFNHHISQPSQYWHGLVWFSDSLALIDISLIAACFPRILTITAAHWNYAISWNIWESFSHYRWQPQLNTGVNPLN